MFKGKKILLGVTGGIAAYKALELTRLLVKGGAEVWPVMTRAAKEFVSPLSFSTLAKNPVSVGLFDQPNEGRIRHVEAPEDADLVIIAPATANIIGKIAGGIADDLLSTLVMATPSPVLIAPAMNCNMYINPIVKKNIHTLEGYGYRFVGPAEGDLACGYEGIGRLAPVEEIFDTAVAMLSPKDLTDEKILITAGGTREVIDPVRFITNASSGRMGYALARAAWRRGAEVVLISGPTGLARPTGVTFKEVVSAEEMYEKSMEYFQQSTTVIMAAAVSDFKPETSHSKKVKKVKAAREIKLETTIDILREMGERKGGRKLIGFALETDDIIDNARKKAVEKKLDFVVANGPASLSSPTSTVTIVDKDGLAVDIPLMSKDELSEQILDRIKAL